MRHFARASLIMLLFFPLSAAPTVAQDDPSCADYDAYEWAQAVFESDPRKYDALDPDGDGQVCPELPRGGFAPAFWLEEIPKDLEEAEIIRVIDGDTLEVRIEGVSNRVRIYRADTPETRGKKECGGEEATTFAEYALSFNDDEDQTVFLERDKTKRDKYGRELAYVWFEVDGLPYMLNHILINNGWADDVDYGDRKYDDELKDAETFAKRNDLGAWELCDGFGKPVPVVKKAAPAAAPQAPRAEQPAPAQPPQAEQPEVPVQEGPAASDCDANYSPCIPPFPPDLDCPDIGFSVQVIGDDPHGLDRDNDGVGCETEQAAQVEPPPAEQPAPEPVPVAPEPEPVAPVEEAPPAQGGGCDPNYSPCVPISAADLDCGDIGFSVTIIGGDPHGFDGNDNDGLGCESF